MECKKWIEHIAFLVYNKSKEALKIVKGDNGK